MAGISSTGSRRAVSTLSGAASSASLFTVEVAGGSPVQISRNCSLVNSGAVWSPDSKRILFAGICQGRAGVWRGSPDGKVSGTQRRVRLLERQQTRSLDASTAPVFDQWLDNPARLLVPLAAGDDISYAASLPMAPKATSQPDPFGHSSSGPQGHACVSIQKRADHTFRRRAKLERLDAQSGRLRTCDRTVRFR